ncbi:hypothetical protein [Verrucomicrobium spinosum]|uniref:hypothetical protein n=1 Tax=Verrucomicrobium spinosum TaxID=2736 RepID=UPI000A84EF8C
MAATQTEVVTTLKAEMERRVKDTGSLLPTSNPAYDASKPSGRGAGGGGGGKKKEKAKEE